MPMSPRLLRPRASGVAFGPRSITSLAAWYDASDASSLFQNSNGTTAVSALNDPVGRWSDKSGNSRHLLQTTNSYRPLYRPADQNGLGVLRGNRVSQTGMSCSWNAQLNAGNTVFAVIMPRFAIPAAEFHPCVRFPATNANALQYESSALVNPASSANRLESFVVAGGTVFRSIPPAAPTQNVLIVATSVVTTSSMALFRNGAVWGAETALTGAISSTTSDTLRIGNATEGSGDTGQYDYAELLVYSAGLSESARLSVDRYLCSKWGITFSG